ncbi:hypothetical protein OSB04_un000161 [Centaurea solstitialis]|uniref:Reverse transcriptase domain-containing protein n=1 Tax=Centaurea solstitialis TaxID=347529 RepID=A0AA38SD82_9ASTR|nr:hypothetical protein OSB04_un000161 [Centaurea solstitialis]
MLDAKSDCIRDHKLVLKVKKKAKSKWATKSKQEKACVSSYISCVRLLETRKTAVLGQEDIEVLDVSYTGIHYTWIQKPKGGDGLHRKLDRIMVNTDFMESFNGTSATFLPHGISDHALGILCIDVGLRKKSRGFKFDNFMADEEDFIKIVENAWGQPVFGSFMHKLLVRLKSLKQPLRCLRNRFGDVSKRVAFLKTELDAVQLACDLDPSNNDLLEDLAHLFLAYERALIDENSYFRQRAKVTWLKEGDINTKFFHNAVKERRGRNVIRAIQDMEGNFVFDEDVSTVLVNHFQVFLGMKDPAVVADLSVDLFANRLSLADSLEMIRPITNEDIKHALFSIGNDKAPGSDGFSAKFFKKAWPIIGDDVQVAVHNFFYSGRMTKEINHTLLCLIPKVPNASRISDFRPISCCTVLYKIISKIISDRMKPYLNHIVGPTQSAFIPGRRIADNILMAHELVAGYQRDTGQPRCAFKIDLRKAYDTVDWDYMSTMLHGFGFHPVLCKWISEMLNTSSFSIALNGETFGFFKGARGLRQGDPISPYLFTLVMEGFSMILKQCIQEATSFLFHQGCEDMNITHLCFADDLFVFTGGNLASVDVLKRALEIFKVKSGLEPNLAKSEIFFCNVTSDVKAAILNSLPLQPGTFPIRYLGVPLSPTCLQVSDFSPLIDKVRGRIHNWKSKFLSFGGRKQLIQSVLHSMQLYWMMVFLIPSSVTHELEKMFRDFLWAQGDDARGKCKVAWERVCTPISCGGLGFKRLALWNRALLTKHIWEILNHRNSLWINFLWRYRIMNGSFWSIRSRPHWSWCFRKLLLLRPTVRKFFMYSLGDGNTVNAWEDTWLAIGPLSSVITYRRFHAVGFRLDSVVKDVISTCAGVWPQEWTSTNPEAFLTPLPNIVPDQSDTLMWVDENTHGCEFTIKAAWKSLSGGNALVPWVKYVWFKSHIPKHSFCLWTACLGRLPTQDHLSSWKENPPDLICPLCECCLDSHDHLFFTCPYSKDVWRKVKREVGLHGFPESWTLIMDLLNEGRGPAKLIQRLALAATVYFVWMERNTRLFRKTKRVGMQIFKDIRSLTMDSDFTELQTAAVDAYVNDLLNPIFFESIYQRVDRFSFERKKSDYKFEKDLQNEHDQMLKHSFGNAQNLKLVTSLRKENDCLKKKVLELDEDKKVFENKLISSQSRVMELSKQVTDFEQNLIIERSSFEKERKVFEEERNVLANERKSFELKSEKFSQKISDLERKIVLDRKEFERRMNVIDSKKKSLKKPSLRVGKYNLHDFEDDIQVVQSERKLDDQKSVELQKRIVDLQNQLSDARSQFKRKEKVLQHEKKVLEQIIAEPKKPTLVEKDFADQKEAFKAEINKLTSKLSGLSTDIMSEQRMRSDQQKKLNDLLAERNKLSSKVKDLEEIIFKAHDSSNVDSASRSNINSSGQIRTSNLFYDRRVDYSGNHLFSNGKFVWQVKGSNAKDIEVSMINPEPEDLPKKHIPRLDLVLMTGSPISATPLPTLKIGHTILRVVVSIVAKCASMLADYPLFEGEQLELEGMLMLLEEKMKYSRSHEGTDTVVDCEVISDDADREHSSAAVVSLVGLTSLLAARVSVSGRRFCRLLSGVLRRSRVSVAYVFRTSVSPIGFPFLDLLFDPISHLAPSRFGWEAALRPSSLGIGCDRRKLTSRVSEASLGFACMAAEGEVPLVVSGDEECYDKSFPELQSTTQRVSVFQRLNVSGKESRWNFTAEEKAKFADVVGENHTRTLKFFPPSSKVDARVTIPLELAQQAAKTYHATLYGYFLGQRLPFWQVQQSVKKAWGKFGYTEMMMNDNGVYFLKFNDEGGCTQAVEQGPLFIRGVPFFVFAWDPSKGLTKPVHSTCPLWIKLYNIPLVAFNVEGIGRIASAIGVPKQMDSATASMCDRAWGRPGFAKVLVEAWATGDLKREIEVVVPSITGENEVIVKVKVEYDWEPTQCSHCMVFGHKKSTCLKEVVSNAKPKAKEVDADGFTRVTTKKWVQKVFKKAGESSSSGGNAAENAIKETSDSPKDQHTQEQEDEHVIPPETIVNMSNADVENIVESSSPKHVEPGTSSTMVRTPPKHTVPGPSDATPTAPSSMDVPIVEPVIRKLQPPPPPSKPPIKGILKNPNRFSALAEEEMKNKDGSGKQGRNMKGTENYGRVSVKPKSLWELSRGFLMGDFNAMLFPHDGFGGCSRRKACMEDFYHCVEDIEVLDVTYTGIHYTWIQKPKGGDGLHRKLDRIMANTDFMELFNGTSAMFHPQGISDHALGILNIDVGLRKKSKGFKFDNFMADDEDFIKIVANEWGKPAFGSFMHKLLVRLKSLKQPLRRLRSRFGDISKRAASLKVELDAIQIACDLDPSNNELLEDLAHLLLAYERALIDENSFFRQRAKVTWLKEGDINTKFFHNVVKEKRGRNVITSIEDLEGNFVFDDDVSTVLVNHFQTFLGLKDSAVVADMSMDLFNNRLSLADSLDMIRPISDDDIKQAVFSIGNDKAPGSDGFSAKFFKKAWPIIGSDVQVAIHNFFYSGRMTKEINHTLLCLIPKVPNASRISDFRPISCCTVLYKIISKIISERIKPYLTHIVGPTQSAFIPGRRIADNILMAHELVAGYQRDVGQPRCAFKIDLRKAYDTVDWDYMRTMLHGFGFHPVLCNWISEMLNTSSFSIALNGDTFGFFKGARGLRQGDPISPYLFTLVMEGFSMILKQCIEETTSFCFHQGCEELNITHLCFADDLFVFTGGNLASVDVLKRALEIFKAKSGLEPNLAKSEIFFCNVNPEVKAAILHSLPLQPGTFPIRYLGVPLSPTCLRVSDFNPLIDKVKVRIHNWKSKFLSFGGRKQLIQSVLHSMQLYWMMVFLIPSSIIHELEKMFRDFLWAQGEDARGKCKVAWEKVCTPINCGGLGFKRLAIWNRALLTKHIWEILSHRNSLWINFLWRYRIMNGSFWSIRSRPHWSWCFRKLLLLRPTVRKFIRHSVGDGSTINAWEDTWLSNGPLSSLITYRRYHAAGFHVDSVVRDVVNTCGGVWPQDWMSTNPDAFLSPLPTIVNGQSDTIMWVDGNNHGRQFTIKEAWKSLNGSNHLVPWVKYVWFKSNIPKHSFCLWTACLGRLPTQDHLSIWKENPPDLLCPLCECCMDTHDHLFFACPYSKEIWRRVKREVGMHGFPESWTLIMDLLNEGRGPVKLIQRLALAATVYFIWIERNTRLFKSTRRIGMQIFKDIRSVIMERVAHRNNLVKMLR